MNVKRYFIDTVKKTKIGQHILSNVVFTASFALLINLIYALYHGIVGINSQSLWFAIMCAYYTILAVTRFSAILCAYHGGSDNSENTEYFVMKMSGILLMLLSLILIAIIYISMSQNIVTKYSEITMITIATYVFVKITITVIKALTQHKSSSPLLTVIRNISYSEVSVSILNLQRSMIVSFGEMSNANILNGLTGAFVCVFVLTLSVLMIKNHTRKDNKYGKI